MFSRTAQMHNEELVSRNVVDTSPIMLMRKAGIFFYTFWVYKKGFKLWSLS